MESAKAHTAARRRQPSPSGRACAVTPGQPLGFPWGSRRVVVPAQPPALGPPVSRAPARACAPLGGGEPPGVTGVVIPVVMAAPATANKGSGARLRAGSARGMACRPSRLPPHQRIWPPGRSCASVCLSPASADRLCAICHLSHALIWEYNIPQWLAVPRHAASSAWLKFQSGNPP